MTGAPAAKSTGDGVDLDLNCVASFLVLLEEGHFGRAAERLNLTTSALTKRIQRLERQVGVPLVVRGPAGSAATAAGLRFAAYAGPLLRTAESARHAALSNDRHGSRQLTIGVPAGPVEYLSQIGVPQAVRHLRESYPEARVHCRLVPFPELTSSLVTGVVDVLVTSNPVQHPGIISVPLPFTVGRIGIVSRTHELADAGAVDVALFADLPLLATVGAPPEWMSSFYLGDVRPASEARLVMLDINDTAAAATAIAQERATVGLAMPGHFSNESVRMLDLIGVPDLVLHLALRRSDRRRVVADFVSAMQGLRPRRLSPEKDAS